MIFSVKEGITRSSLVKPANAQEVAKDSVTDLFDPLLTDSKNAVGNHVTQSNLASITEARKNYFSNSKTSVLKDLQLVSYGNTIILPQDNNLCPTNSLDVNTAGSALVTLKGGCKKKFSEMKTNCHTSELHNQLSHYLPVDHKKHKCNCLYNFLITPIQLLNRLL